MSVGRDLRDSLKECAGVDVNRQRTEEWVEEIGDKLSRSKDLYDMNFITSGNMIVVARSCKDDLSGQTVEVWVCKIEQKGHVYTNSPVTVQHNSAFCSCASPRVKRVDISSNLSYDFCEICKKERK